MPTDSGAFIVNITFHVQIVNATSHPLLLRSSSRNQMKWDPPPRVEANSIVPFTAAFEIHYTTISTGDNTITVETENPNSRNDHAEAVFELDGVPGFSFTLTATKTGMEDLPPAIPEHAGYGLQVQWHNIPKGIVVYPPRDTSNLSGVGWIKGGTVTIGLSQADDAASVSIFPYRTPKYGDDYEGEVSGLRTSVQAWAASWMGIYHHCLRDLTLTELTLPGAHDAASFGAGQFLAQSWVQTQYLNLRQQLEQGIRALDLRLAKTDDKAEPFQFVHGWFQTNLSLTDGLRQISDFMRDHTREVVILDFHKLERTWTLDDAKALVHQLEQTFGSLIVPFNQRNLTYGELLDAGQRIVIGLGQYTKDDVPSDIVSWLQTQPSCCYDAVEQYWMGSSVTTWGSLESYMTEQLAAIGQPRDHIWAFMSQYNAYTDLGTPTNLPVEISNFFTGRNGLRSNIIHSDWWNRLNRFDLTQEAGTPNFSALINAVPLNLLKGFRKANKLRIFGPYPPSVGPAGSMAGFALNGNDPWFYYQDTNNNIAEFRWGKPTANAWSNRTLANTDSSPQPAPGSTILAFTINDNQPRLYHLDSKNNVIERAGDGADWSGRNLTTATNLPVAAKQSALAGFALNNRDPRVYYLDDSGNVIELAWGGGKWGGGNPTESAKSQVARSGSALAAFAIGGSRPRVYYVDDDAKITELA